MTWEELEAQGYRLLENTDVFRICRYTKTDLITILMHSHHGLTPQKIDEISREAATLHFVKSRLDGEKDD